MQEDETASEKMATVHYHEEEAMYISAQTDRVTVIFSTLFKDPDDIVIGKVGSQNSAIYLPFSLQSRLKRDSFTCKPINHVNHYYFLQVFLQEFKDARKAHQQAPQVLFSYGEPPRELKGCPGVQQGDNVGYVQLLGIN